MIYEFISFEPDSKRGVDGTMTVHARWRPFPWLFVEEQLQEMQFRGSGTVWHRLSDFRRPGVLMEALLADYKSRWDHEQQKRDPDAHRQGAA